MTSGPYSMGAGRNGPGQGRALGQPGARVAAPYRPDIADVDFVAVGDVVVCVLAPSRMEVDRGDVTLHVPERESHFHTVLAVGQKVGEKLGVDLDVGDTIFIVGGSRIETLAGSVWFVRAEHVLSVIEKRTQETQPPPPLVEDSVA